jgi:hypothetical protein
VRKALLEFIAGDVATKSGSSRARPPISAKPGSATLATDLAPVFVVFRRRDTAALLEFSNRRIAMKSVVVTGASTGIGWGCAKVLIGSGFRVFGGVRKPADADRLSEEFGASFGPAPRGDALARLRRLVPAVGGHPAMEVWLKRV